MNINIGIRGATRELSMNDLEMTEDELLNIITEATSQGTPLQLKEKNGRTLIIPAQSLGYVEISDKEKRLVGFGILNQ